MMAKWLLISYQFMNDCLGFCNFGLTHTVFNKIGLNKTVSGCALAVKYMKVAWLDFKRHY